MVLVEGKPDEIRAILLSDNPAARQEFVTHLSSEIEEFVTAIAAAYQRLRAMPEGLKNERRPAWVYEYVFVAFNSLLTAVHLLLSGFSLPFGNLQRHFGEAVAMALLLSHPGINIFERLEKDPKIVPVHKAIDILSQKRNARLVGVDPNAVQELSKGISFFDHHSHASVFAVASLRLYAAGDSRQVAGEFDVEKLEEYRKDLRLSVSGCHRLADAVTLAKSNLIRAGYGSD